MKKYGLSLLILLMFAPLVMSAKGNAAPDTISARRAFLELPAHVIDLLPQETRLDMVAYWDVDSIWDAPNEFAGISKLTALTPNYAEVSITPVSTMQIKVLPYGKDGNVVMTVYTTGGAGESKDSDIRFYDASMKELEASKFFKTPLLKDFFKFEKGSKMKMKDIEEMMPFYTIDFTTDPEKNILTGVLTPDDFLTVEDMKLVTLYLKPSIVYQWDGKRLKLMDK